MSIIYNIKRTFRGICPPVCSPSAAFVSFKNSKEFKLFDLEHLLKEYPKYRRLVRFVLTVWLSELMADPESGLKKEISKNDQLMRDFFVGCCGKVSSDAGGK